MAGAEAKRREERVKLFASALSNIGVATVVTGFIAPLAGGRLQPFVALGSLMLGMGLHFVAQGVLHYVIDADAQLATAAPEAEL